MHISGIPHYFSNHNPAHAGNRRVRFGENHDPRKGLTKKMVETVRDVVTTVPSAARNLNWIEDNRWYTRLSQDEATLRRYLHTQQQQLQILDARIAAVARKHQRLEKHQSTSRLTCRAHKLKQHVLTLLAEKMQRLQDCVLIQQIQAQKAIRPNVIATTQLKTPWPRNAMVAASSSQKEISLRQAFFSLIYQALQSSDSVLEALLKASETVAVVNARGSHINPQLQSMVLSENRVDGWHKMDRNKPRYVLMIIGEGNIDNKEPQTKARDELQHAAELFLIEGILQEQYRVPSDNIQVLFKPSLKQVRQAFAKMHAFARKNPHAEAIVMGSAHGWVRCRHGQEMIEKGLSIADQQKEGACKSYLLLRYGPDKKSKDHILDKDCLKHLCREYLPSELFDSVFLLLSGCRSGGFVA